jgi:predicted hydrocarbon binding protein
MIYREKRMFIKPFGVLIIMNSKEKWSETFKKDYVEANIKLTEEQLKEEKKDEFPELIKYCGKESAKKLLKEAGSLKKLALMRWQTIYTLGSKRFFSSGMRKMEAGIIAKHPNYSMEGVDVAKNISVAARKDFFGKTI